MRNNRWLSGCGRRQWRLEYSQKRVSMRMRGETTLVVMFMCVCVRPSMHYSSDIPAIHSAVFTLHVSIVTSTSHHAIYHIHISTTLKLILTEKIMLFNEEQTKIHGCVSIL